MSMGKLQSEDSSPLMAEINTTPLVDVMLVLLVIFIITAPLLTTAVKLELPNAPAQPLVPTGDAIKISIDANNQFFWNSEPVTTDELYQRLKSSASSQQTPDIQLRADKKTHYESVAKLLAWATELGLVKIGFVTTPDDESSKPVAKSASDLTKEK